MAEIGKAIAVQPNKPDLYLHRAEYNFLLEKKAAVLEDAQKAPTVNPTDKKVLYFSAPPLLARGLQLSTKQLELV